MKERKLPSKMLINIFNLPNPDIIVYGVKMTDVKIEVLLIDRKVNRNVTDINSQQPNKIWISVYEIKDNKIVYVKDIPCSHVPTRIVPEMIGIPTEFEFPQN